MPAHSTCVVPVQREMKNFLPSPLTPLTRHFDSQIRVSDALGFPRLVRKMNCYSPLPPIIKWVEGGVADCFFPHRISRARGRCGCEGAPRRHRSDARLATRGGGFKLSDCLGGVGIHD